jgi:hypothetical protein
MWIQDDASHTPSDGDAQTSCRSMVLCRDSDRDIKGETRLHLGRLWVRAQPCAETRPRAHSCNPGSGRPRSYIPADLAI